MQHFILSLPSLPLLCCCTAALVFGTPAGAQQVRSSAGAQTITELLPAPPAKDAATIELAQAADASVPAAAEAPVEEVAPIEAEASPAVPPASDAAPAVESEAAGADAEPYSAQDQSSPYLTPSTAPAPAGKQEPLPPGGKRTRLGGWEITVNPQVWVPTMTGDVVVEGVEGDINLSFIDTLENAEFPVAISLGARHDKLSLFFDYMSMDLRADDENLDVDLGPQTDSALDPLRERLAAGIIDPVTLAILDDTGLDVDLDGQLDVSVMLAEMGVGYRIWEASEEREGATLNSSFDVVGGVRYWKVETKMDVDIAASYDADQLPANLQSLATRREERSVLYQHEESWVDPVIGGRFKTDLSDDTALILGGDIGGFGLGSDLTWKLSSVIQHSPNESFQLYAGYQAIHVDYNNGDSADDNDDRDKDDFRLNNTFHGPVVGAKLVF